jgi:hypothetical protein
LIATLLLWGLIAFLAFVAAPYSLTSERVDGDRDS